MKTLFAAAFSLSTFVCVCSATIVSGDVAIVRVNNNVDGFSLLALRDIAAGEVLFATDDGWKMTGGFRTGEGAGATDFITAAIPKGTVFDVTAAQVGGGNFNLSASGDQVILFTGTLASPSLVFAVDWGNGAGWDADATSANTSADPATQPIASPPLTDRLTVSLGIAAAYKYVGPTTGTADNLLNAIGDAANWATTSDSAWTGGQFTVLAVPEPAGWSVISAIALLGIFGLRTYQERRTTAI